MADRSSSAASISKTLSTKTDWIDWLAEVQSEATRLGLQTSLNHVMNGAAPHVAAAQAQKWRNLRKAVQDSVRDSAAEFLKDHEPNGMNAGQIK